MSFNGALSRRCRSITICINNLFSVVHLGSLSCLLRIRRFSCLLRSGFIGAFLIDRLQAHNVPGAFSYSRDVLSVRRDHRRSVAGGGHEIVPLYFRYCIHLVSELYWAHSSRLHRHQPHYNTAALSLMVFVIVIVYGVYSHVALVRLLFPRVPSYICRWWFSSSMSFLSRPIRFSSGWFANMLAGTYASGFCRIYNDAG